MTDLLFAIARFVARRLPDWLPPGKALWARAMRREIEETQSPGEALAFALGCAWAALKERVRTMEAMIAIGRMLVPAVMLALVAVTSMSARRLMQIDQAVGTSLALVAAAYLLAALLTILRGPRALIAASGAMLGFHLFVCIWMLAAPESLPGGPFEPIQRALLIEGFAIWTLLLGAGYFLVWAPRLFGAKTGSG